ncbi:MAG: hypothetical protein ACRBF0_20140 [Calditrichia bacterium]
MDGLSIITLILLGLIVLALLFGAMARRNDRKQKKNRINVDDFL